ncbi:MAG: hypothetical protein SynsKO_39360 [Synoicihabitans sp.]
MVEWISQLPPFPKLREEDRANAHPVHFLTGKPFLHLTLSSAASLLRRSSIPLRLVVVSDGTLDEPAIDLLRKRFPGRLTVESEASIEERMESYFPRKTFPHLRETRDTANLFRKLMDVHGGASGWNVFIDSDTFFWRCPKRLENGLQSGGRAVYSPDRFSNYGHPSDVISRILGEPVTSRVNSGLTGMMSEEIDWERMEFWLAGIRSEVGGKPDFWEQALTAMHMTSISAESLPAKDYILSPSVSEIRSPTGVFHHYAGASKHRFIRMMVPLALGHTKVENK